MIKTIQQQDAENKELQQSLKKAPEAPKAEQKPKTAPPSQSRQKNAPTVAQASSATVILDDLKAKSLLSYGLNKFQIEMIYAPTPKQFIKNRVGRGGKRFDYIPIYIVVKYLNMIFGCGWNFEITKEDIMLEHKQVLVKGRLTVNLVNGNQIIKEQYASKEVQVYSNKPQYGKVNPNAGKIISIGDDLKGAASLCLTKCASYLGLFSDIYSSEFYTKYEMPDGFDEKDYEQDKLFESTKELIKKLDKDKKKEAIDRAVKSNQFNKEQCEELKKLCK